MLKVEMKGKVFDRLFVLHEAGRDAKGYVTWLCRCDHGQSGVRPKRLVVSGMDLRNGNKKSCGCLAHEAHVRQGKSFTRHGLSQTPLYQVWRNMKARCMNPSAWDYPRYGGRGITVCADWLISDNFFSWALTHGYEPHLTIERRNNYRGYCPSNCRWATMKVQVRHRRNTLMATWRGITKPLIDHAEDAGISYAVVYDRVKRGWNPVDALMTTVDRYTKTHARVDGKLVRRVA